MKYINPPELLPAHVTHKIFFSRLYNHEIGYSIYLPPDYGSNKEEYPISYHLHGWTGNESSEIWTMEKVYSGKRAITVFPNSSPVIENCENLPVEAMLVDELLPYIEREYRIGTTRESRSVSGFSMGGGMAFVYAIKHPEVFSSVTAYAGTYHHYFHKGSHTVGEPPEKAAALFEEMIRERRFMEDNNILSIVRQNAERIRGALHIAMHIGANDILFCDNEIMHLYLDSLAIPHVYEIFDDVAHELSGILGGLQHGRGN